MKQASSVNAAVGAGKAADISLVQLHKQYWATRSTVLRDELVHRYERLAYGMVARLNDRTGDPEDLQQTALIGLLKAVERFDPDRGVAFTTYAWATISGELKRYYRDSTWGMRVPRHLQERYLDVSHVLDDLSTRLHRSPTLPEIAEEAGMTVDDVAEAIELQHVRRIASMDMPTRDDGSRPDLAITADDAGHTENRVLLQTLLQRLPERDRNIVWLRFGCEMSQSEIAGRVGVSQMQVSRLLGRSLARLRELAHDDHADHDYPASVPA